MATVVESSVHEPNNTYTVIGFWRWVFERAISKIEATGFSSRRELCRFHNLSKNVMRLDRPATANFVFSNRLVLGDSFVLEKLEDKDLFVTTMNKYSKDKIPQSSLVPYDTHLCLEKDLLELPSIPAVLKQPLGCCGHGVYFVSTVEEVLSKVEGNYERAHAAAEDEHARFRRGHDHSRPRDPR